MESKPRLVDSQNDTTLCGLSANHSNSFGFGWTHTVAFVSFAKVGVGDGSDEGVLDGNLDGSCDGNGVGYHVGLVDGMEDGTRVGKKVGDDLGLVDGKGDVGYAKGTGACPVGRGVGSGVGT